MEARVILAHCQLQPEKQEASSFRARSSHDNALAENMIGLYKTEVIEHQGPWQGKSDVEMATLTWVDWYNNDRLFGPIGYIPPAQAERNFYETLNQYDIAAE